MSLELTKRQMNENRPEMRKSNLKGISLTGAGSAGKAQENTARYKEIIRCSMHRHIMLQWDWR